MTRHTRDPTGASSDDGSGTANGSRRRFLKAAASMGVVGLGLGTGVAGAAGTETAFTVRNVGVGGDDGASLEDRGGHVAIDGRLSVPNPCYTASLGTARVDDETLYVVVQPSRDPNAGDVCVTAEGSVEYSAEVSFENAVSTVVVEHGGEPGWHREFDLLGADAPISPGPTELSVSAASATTATLSFLSSHVFAPSTRQLDHVAVYVDGEVDHTVPVDAISTGSATSTTVTGLRPDTTYQFAVAPVDAFGREGARVTASARTPDGTPRTTEPTTAATTASEPTPGRVGSNTALPGDPDGDSLFGDVNGNDRQDIADAVDLFQHREDVDAAYFDFTESGGVSIGDAVSLFRENAG